MTNAEKFREVFGLEPDMEASPFECGHSELGNSSDNCPYLDDYGCHCEKWWGEEYKEGVEE